MDFFDNNMYCTINIYYKCNGTYIFNEFYSKLKSGNRQIFLIIPQSFLGVQKPFLTLIVRIFDFDFFAFRTSFLHTKFLGNLRNKNQWNTPLITTNFGVNISSSCAGIWGLIDWIPIN